MDEQRSFAELFDPRAPIPDKEEGEGLRPERQRVSTLDLHGLTCAEAEIRIEAFIQRCAGDGTTTARIVTGVGRHSENGPVLKGCAERMLRRLKKAGLVAAVRWEGREKESGALLARLARQHNPPPELRTRE